MKHAKPVYTTEGTQTTKGHQSWLKQTMLGFPLLPKTLGKARFLSPLKLSILLLGMLFNTVPLYAGKITVHKSVLPNGLKVLLIPRSYAPTVVCRLFYTTGSVHEAPGNTGIAHMLEHMLFKGTHKVGITDSISDKKLMIALDSVLALSRATLDTAQRAMYMRSHDSLLALQRKLMIKDELWGAYKAEGGTGLNAFTSDLMTAYFVTLPRNKLELFLWLESDRMKNAVLREFLPERDVVMEERRMRYEDSPYGRYFETLNSLFYEAHPFRLPTIGYASDISAYTREQAAEHYRKYYKPNNAILVLAGDLDTSKTMERVRAYFSPIPPGDSLAPVVTREPEPIGEKRITLYKDAAQPRLDLLLLTPGYPHPDLHALEVAQGVLSGKSGRLYQHLVERKKIALDASAGNAPELYHSSFHIWAQVDPKISVDLLQDELWNVIDTLKSQLISPRELQRVKNQVLMQSQLSLRDLEHLATELAFHELRGGWEAINTVPEAIRQVTTSQVRDVFRKYFNRNKATLGLVLPEKSAP